MEEQNTDFNVSKTKSIPLLTAFITLAVGICLIICNKMITGHGIIVLAGILFLLTGIINIVVYVSNPGSPEKNTKKGLSLVLGWAVSIASVILGLCMLVFIDVFTAMIPFIFGILIFFGAVTAGCMLIFIIRPFYPQSNWLWLFPSAILILGIITILQEAVASDPTIMILTGIAMSLFGIFCLVGFIMMRKKRIKPTEVKNIEE